MSWGHKEQRVWSLVRCGLLANVSASVSVTTECLSGGKWLLYTMALWPWPSRSDTNQFHLFEFYRWKVFRKAHFQSPLHSHIHTHTQIFCFQLPPIDFSYQYCDTLYTMWQMNLSAPVKKVNCKSEKATVTSGRSKEGACSWQPPPPMDQNFFNFIGFYRKFY